MKNILLTEAQFKDYMRFQKNQLNEIDWKTSKDAYEKSNYSNWYTIHNRAEDLLDALKDEITGDNRTYHLHDRNYDENSQTMKWIKVIEKFCDFASRKDSQTDNLEKLHTNNFVNQHDGMEEPEYGRMLNSKYDEFNKEHEDDDEFYSEDDFMSTLSDKEKDYWKNGM